MSSTLTLKARPARDLATLDAFDSHHVSTSPELIGIRSAVAFKNAMPRDGGNFSPSVGQAVSTWYRNEYPRNTAKQVARENGCAVSTAEKWLRGQCPATEALLRMLAAKGAAFFAHVFASVTPDIAELADLSARTDELGKRLHKLNADFDRLTGSDT